MQRYFAILLVATLGTQARAQESAHEKCLKASDYKGCIEVMEGGSAAPTAASQLNSLKSALKLLPSRLENTNLRDFTSNTQMFNDAVSAVDASALKTEYEKELFAEARSIQQMVYALQAYWSTRINRGTYYGSYGYKSYYCSVLRPALSVFNSYAGATYSVSYNGYTTGGGFLNPKMEKCSPQEGDMMRSISRRVSESLVDPEVRKAQLAKEKRERELAKMEPWLRHLEQNPGLKKWAEANPKAAETAKEKFLKSLPPKGTGASGSPHGYWNSDFKIAD